MQNELIDKSTFQIGIIGFGDMGKLYARRMSDAGYKVAVCDLPQKHEFVKADLLVSTNNLTVYKDGAELSKVCDFVIYSVEAANIDKVIQQFSGHTKPGAIVGGQTAVKSIEVKAFELNLNKKDVDIITFHSMHGPNVDPINQPLLLVNQRNNFNSFDKVKQIFINSFKSKIVELRNFHEHDKLCAVTQAATHVAFLSMGTAWKNRKSYPWDYGPYSKGGIENVKTNIALRIYSSKWHVYADLAILNKEAWPIIETYSQSVNDLFELMITKNREKLTDRVYEAKNFIFRSNHSQKILGGMEDILDEFKIEDKKNAITKNFTKYTENTHLSLLAVVDCWYKLKINPYDYQICETPPFKLYLGIVEKLFLTEDMLKSAIESSLNNFSVKGDDLAFCSSVVGWSECIRFKNIEAFRDRFNETKEFFTPMLNNAMEMSSKMIKAMNNRG